MIAVAAALCICNTTTGDFGAILILDLSGLELIDQIL